MQDSRGCAKGSVSGSQVKFAREFLSDVFDEAVALTKENNDETGAIESAHFAPDRERYLAIEKLDMIMCFTLRKAGVLIGYCLLFVHSHLHYSKMLWATQDTLFVSKAYRGLTAVKFIKWVDEQLKAMSVDVVLRQVTSKLDFSRTLSRMGYEAIETSFMRRLV